MSTNDSDVADAFGMDAYVWGLKIVFWLYALFVFLRIVGPAGTALSAATQAGPYSSDATQGVLALTLIGLLVALFVGLFFATFVFVSVHGVDVLLTSSVAAGSDVPASLTTNAQASGAVAIEPGLFFPAGLSQLFYLLPPALLVFAGYRERRVEGETAVAVTKVVFGYGIMAVVTILPVAWIFNNVVASMVSGLLSSPLVDTTIRLQYPSVIGAHLFVAVGYPLVFGGIGAFLASASDDSSGHQRQEPRRDDGRQGYQEPQRGYQSDPNRQPQGQQAHQPRGGAYQGQGGHQRGQHHQRPQDHQQQPQDHHQRSRGHHQPPQNRQQQPPNHHQQRQDHQQYRQDHQQHPQDQQQGRYQQRGGQQQPHSGQQSPANHQPRRKQPRNQRAPPNRGQDRPPAGEPGQRPSGPAQGPSSDGQQAPEAEEREADPRHDEDDRGGRQ